MAATLMVSAGAAEEAAEDAPPAPVEAAVELEELPPQAAKPTAAAPAPTILIKLRREMRFIVLSSNSIDSCPQAHRAVYAGNAGPPAEKSRDAGVCVAAAPAAAGHGAAKTASFSGQDSVQRLWEMRPFGAVRPHRRRTLLCTQYSGFCRPPQALSCLVFYISCF